MVAMKMQTENPTVTRYEAPPCGGDGAADVTMIDANAKLDKLDMKW